MKSRYIQHILIIGVLLLLVGAGVVIKGNSDAQADTPVPLDGTVDPVIAQSSLVSSTPASQQLAISVGLQTRNTGELDSLLSAINDPASSSYHQYLTPDEFTQQFAPTDDQVQQVESYLQSKGMTVKNVASDNLLLDAEATVGQAQQAFSVHINTYSHAKKKYYANATSVRVPARIRSLIVTVAGLDSNAKVYNHYQGMKGATKAGPIGGYGPREIDNTYDISPLQNAGMLGEKQTIALFEMDGYLPIDVASYMLYYNPASALQSLLPSTATSNLTNIMVDNYNGAAGQYASEVSLDIEMVDAIAPRANVLVYEGPDTLQGMNDTYAKIVNDNKTQIVSTSWGTCEAASGNAELQLLDNLFKQGAAQGMSFFAAAGDAGAYDCGDTNLAVDSPGSDPYVTSVGGTTLQLNGNGTVQDETAWADPNNPYTNNEEGVGGGGGLSSYFAQPSWQRGPGVQNSYSNGKREVPDVVADADLNTGYSIYCTVLNSVCPSTGWTESGGTSAAAPLWAASIALVNQYLQSQGKKPLSLVVSALYKLYNSAQTYPAFHDITTGTNLFYSATANYDLASGMGSPDVYNIARDLAGN